MPRATRQMPPELPSRYPPGYRPGESRRPARLPPRPGPKSPGEQLPAWTLDRRGERHITLFGLLVVALLALVVVSMAMVVFDRLNDDLGLASGESVTAVSPTTATFPIVWSVRREQSPDGHEYYSAVPPEVADQVKQDFLAGWKWYYASEALPDPAEAERYYTGAYLQAVERGLSYYEEHGYYAYWEAEDFQWVGPVEFSDDGARATLTVTLVGPFDVYQLDTVQPSTRLRSSTRSGWRMTASLAWDSRNGRWRAYDDVSGEEP
jgi:hypothetical protein